jgi:hypothetical protein
MPGDSITTPAFLTSLDAMKDLRRRELMLPSSGGFAILPEFTGELWTAKQRAAHSLHEISYRACFKPQLPRFFIERLTRPGGVVYDPFAGRGTTLLEAAFLGRRPIGNDINPIARLLVLPRLDPPTIEEIGARLDEYDLAGRAAEERPPWRRRHGLASCRRATTPKDLLVFYHPETLGKLIALRRILLERERAGQIDRVDAWIRMVALNRLTGHSPGFFSVYSLPPNQAVSVASQQKINQRLKQKPEPRDVKAIILKKSRSLLADLTPAERRRLAGAASRAFFAIEPADRTASIADASVDLVVTSPPFLDVVDYATDNWLRCWLAGIDAKSVPITFTRSLADWTSMMERVFGELRRILKRRGRIAFEVGEVRKGTVRLEESIVAAAAAAGLEPVAIVINAQRFTKTAHCWGIENQDKGTNTNRIVLIEKRR